jgi:hypothetical protein
MALLKFFAGTARLRQGFGGLRSTYDDTERLSFHIFYIYMVGLLRDLSLRTGTGRCDRRRQIWGLVRLIR